MFLWCWLCYFQQKDGVRHSVYVFYLAQWFIPFIPPAIKGGSVWFWTKFKTSTVCALTDYLKFGSSAFAWSWLSISAAGATYCTNVFWDWIEPFCVSCLSNVLFFCVSLLKYRYHSLAVLYITKPAGALSNSCVCACVCAYVFVCVRACVCMFYSCFCLSVSQKVVCKYAGRLCVSLVRVHMRVCAPPQCYFTATHRKWHLHGKDG